MLNPKIQTIPHLELYNFSVAPVARRIGTEFPFFAQKITLWPKVPQIS